MSISEAFRAWMNQPVLDAVTKLQMEVVKIMATQADLDSAITALGQVITSEDAGITALIGEVTALIAKIQANPTADFTSEVTGLQSMASDLTNQVAAIQASLNTAKPVTGQ